MIVTEQANEPRMYNDIRIGVHGRGVRRSSLSNPISPVELPVDEQFRLVKESGVFDYFQKLSTPENVRDYVRAIEKYEIPSETPTWYYMLGRDEGLLERNIRLTREIGAKCHNIMTFTRHADGHVLTDDEITDHYLHAYDCGMAVGVEPSFELHVNMWTEDFRRVSVISDRVRRRGVPFNFTLDYSHVNFKIGNPEELDISGVREEVESGRMVLDPFDEHSLCEEWLQLGIVRFVQLRSVRPNQQRNLWARNEDGSLPRGIQYPFIKPKPGEWHSSWDAYLLEPSKEVIRKALRYHVTHPDSPLRYVSAEMIDLPDYGLGAKYDLFDHNVAAAKFIRRAWAEAKALNEAGLLA
jgi:hypothetical protein